MAHLTKLQRGCALAATIIASSMGFIDSTIVHIALPGIQRDLGTSFAALQWIANTYLLALCALLVVSGALGDRYGPRRLFMIGIAGFTVASAACAAAPDSFWLISARTFQGISAALMLPQSLSIIARLYPPEQRGKAVGIWSAVASAAAATGPVIGGFLVDNGGWPYAFWVNLPLGLLALVLAKIAVPRGTERQPVPLDWPGALLLVGGLGAFVFATINLSLHPVNSLLVWPGWLLGAVAIIVFYQWEQRATQPILPAHFLANREFVLLNVYCLTIFATFAAVMFLLPYMLITSLGLSASTAALNMLPMGVCISLMARPVGAWADRIGYRLPMIYSAFAMALVCACACSIVWFRVPWAGAIVMGAFGISAGLMVTPLTTGVLNSVSTDESGLACGINHAVTRIGHLLSIALFGVVLALRYAYHLQSSLVATVSDEAERSKLAPVVLETAEAISAPELSLLPESMHTTVQVVTSLALDRAFIEVMLAASVFALLAAWSATLLSRDGG